MSPQLQKVLNEIEQLSAEEQLEVISYATEQLKRRTATKSSLASLPSIGARTAGRLSSHCQYLVVEERELIMTTQTGLGIKELLQDQRDKILAITEKHGAYNVRVFGSVARGEATAESDIDFLIDYDLERITPWFPAGLMLDLEKLLNRKVDVVPADSVHYFIKDRVLQEAVPL